MLNFSDYNYTKYSEEPSFKRRMAGDVFERMSGEKGWQAKSTSAANLPEGISTTNTNAGNNNNENKRYERSSNRSVAQQKLYDKILSDKDNASEHIGNYADSVMQKTREYTKTPEYTEMMKEHNQNVLDRAGVGSKEEYYASDAHQQRRAQAQADTTAHKARQAKLKAGATHHEANGLVNKYM